MTEKKQPGRRCPTAWWPVLAIMVMAHYQETGAQTATVSGYLAKERVAPGAVGVLVKCLDNDSVVVNLNADALYIPASVEKAVTAAAAYERLGATYTFKTKVFIDGALNQDSGVVDGNLYVRGGGDPGFLAERIWLFVQQLYLQGIRDIRGDLVLDGSFFDTASVGPGFAEDLSSKPYESMVGPLSGSFNSVAVNFRPAGRAGLPVLVDPFPRMDGLRIESAAKTTAAGGATTVEVSSASLPGGGTRVILSGAMPVDASPRFEYVKTWATAFAFGKELQPLFRETGITLRGSVRTGIVPDTLASREPFYVFESLPLFDFIRYMFKYSNNFAAEMLFKTLAAEAAGGRGGSWQAGSALVKQWWHAAQLPGDLTVDNGSGMGKGDRISPKQLVALFDHVWHRQDYFGDYCGLMPVAGIDGTLKSRFKKSRLKGIVRAKTGSLQSYGSSTLAGYALYPGKTYAFAVLFNTRAIDMYRIWDIQEKILEMSLP